MKKIVIVPILLMILLAAGYVLALTQAAAIPSPTIVLFGSDLPSLTLASAEAGATSVVLSWHVLNVAEPYQLHLDAYELNEWVSLLDEDEELSPTGTRTLFVTHPVNFGPPTYRLSVVDEEGQVLDERTLIVPYEVETEPEFPSIEDFTATAENVDVNALSQGSARIAVAWEVTNRLPTANLVFEQVLEDETVTSVELPRPNLWVASEGEGVVAPVSPQSASEVRLRLRVVDVISSQTYDEAELTLPIGGTINTPAPNPTRLTATPVRPTSPPATGGIQIVAFTVIPNPIERGGTVTVSWEVRGATSILIYNRTQTERFPTPILSNAPPSGSIAVPLTGDRVASAPDIAFLLVANNDTSGYDDETVIVQFINTNPQDARVTVFNAAPTSVGRGQGVSLNWQATGTSGVVLEILDVSPGANSTTPVSIQRGLLANSSAQIAIPESITGTARLVLWPVNQFREDTANPYSYRQGTSASVDIQIGCQFVFFTSFGTQSGCPAGDARTIQAAFEPFERGYMVWRGDTGAVYALHNDGSVSIYQQSQYEGLPDAQVNEQPPAGRFYPVSGFGRVWANLGERDRLGWATSSEQGYSMNIQDIAISTDPNHPYTLYFNLPNGGLVGMIGTNTWNTIQ
jgi:hypothetical protein